MNTEAHMVGTEAGDVVMELSLVNPEAITWDVLDGAIIGMATRGPGKPDVAVYDRDKCLLAY